ncbi:DNA repair exonuclease [Aquiflexum sp. LQ15W]|uniref:metallophosphoesterase family protein n=1 Tax=Cognataquiflexum nitidum TaxID=2922272 RepID=UPI001F128D50|nr:DNA repair exonuclease [Cognataquiflexum nitidum]MCH6198630.1 DNA repair exonuclease [Cognataquiflexum nitidum]
MSITFIHTADWQIGKPFASLTDETKRARLSGARLTAIAQLATCVTAHQAAFVLVAGDLWDSITPTKALVSETLHAIGQIPVPVYVIPGNHDHGAMGSIWHQPFFLKEKEALSPNLQVLLAAEPLELEQVVLLPCPLLRKHESTDLSQWLRDPECYHNLGNKPRIVLAHGSVSTFGSERFEDDEELGSSSANLLDLTRLPMDELDYVALGDWHGTKQIDAKSWYAGTPEPDRFPKGEAHDQGNMLLVRAERGKTPEVNVLKTTSISWQRQSFHFAGDTSFDAFENAMETWLGKRVNQDLLQLSLRGSLGLEALDQLLTRLEVYESRLIRIKLDNQVLPDPTAEELDSLGQSRQNPLLARVAAQLNILIQQGGEEAFIAREALKQLYITNKAI